MSNKQQYREINESIKVLNDIKYTNTAINQLIISGNSNNNKLIYLLNQINNSYNNSNNSNNSNNNNSNNSLEIYSFKILLELCKIQSNIIYILNYNLIIEKLIENMKIINNNSCEIIEIITITIINNLNHSSSSSSNDNNNNNNNYNGNIDSNEIINKLVKYFNSIINNCIEILLSNESELYEFAINILCNLLELSEGRELIHVISNFGNIQFYDQICNLRLRFSLDSLCTLFMQISRTSISRIPMYQCQGVLPLLLEGLKEINNNKLNKTCLICLMNLSGEESNRNSMFIDDILTSVIRMAREHKGKLRQCSIGILLNLSFSIVTNYEYGNYLIEFPKFLESILLASNATEITTKCYAIGIFCNLTTCIENRIMLIQLPFRLQLIETLMNILISNEHIHDVTDSQINDNERKNNSINLQTERQNRLISNSGSHSHSHSHISIYCLLSDCYQILQNLTSPFIPPNTTSIPSTKSTPSSTTTTTTYTNPNNQQFNQYQDLYKQWIFQFILHNNCSFLYHLLKLLINFNKKNKLQLKYFQVFDNILPIITKLLFSDLQQNNIHDKQSNLYNLNKIVMKINSNLLNLLNNFQYLLYDKMIVINFLTQLNKNDEFNFLSDEKVTNKKVDLNVKRKSTNTVTFEETKQSSDSIRKTLNIAEPKEQQNEGNIQNSDNNSIKQNSSFKETSKLVK